MNQRIRTYIIFGFCCSLFVSGCVWQTTDPRATEEEQNTSNEMRFGVKSLESRSGIIENAEQIKSLGVFGYSTGADDYDRNNPGHTPNLLWNQKVTRENADDAWTYNPVVYWPTDVAVKNSFFAYSPHSSDFSVDNYVIVSERGASGNPTLQYSVPTNNIDSMFDILYAAPRLNKNRQSTDGVQDGIVKYDMKHAMSGIAFLVTGIKIVDDEEDNTEPEHDNLYHLNYLAFRADRMPVTATLDLGYVPTSDSDYGDAAWSAPLAYSSVNYVFEFDPALIEASESDEEGVVDVPAGEIVDPTTGKNLLLFLPKNIDSTAGATVTVTFIYENVEYWYYIDMPPVFMHAGLVTVFIVTLSVDGVTVIFKETNRIEEWVRGNEGNPEVVEMF